MSVDEPIQDAENLDLDPEDPSLSPGPRVVDTADIDEHRPFAYDIAVSSRDPDVFGLVRRLQNGDIAVPRFQRGYVWNKRQADRFIESLLLGLPIPGIFLAELPDRTEQLVLDGQQRLRTLQYFYEGAFQGRLFALKYVEQKLQGLTYNDLSPDQRRRLDNTSINATIVRQHAPMGHESIFLIFERINSGGTSLAPQEIRSALFQGALEDLLRELNGLPEWRSVFGGESKRMKDQELILRFFALHYDADTYERPMRSFLNDWMKAHRSLKDLSAQELHHTFSSSIKLVARALGRAAFRPQASINAAVFDSVMVATARRVAQGPVKDERAFASAYFELLEDPDYRWRTLRATADTDSVKGRIDRATEAFRKVP